MTGVDDTRLHDTIVMRRPLPKGVIDDAREQALWLATQKKRWRSLALVPIGDVSTVPLAHMLAEIAWCYTGQPTCVADLRDVSLRLADHRLQEVALQTDDGELVVIALDALRSNPAGLTLASGADAVVLCIVLGTSRIQDARKDLADIGRTKVLGAIVVDEEGRPI